MNSTLSIVGLVALSMFAGVGMWFVAVSSGWVGQIIFGG